MSSIYKPDGETSSPCAGDLPLAEEDLSDEALEQFAADRRAADFTDPKLPPPEPPPLAPGETATPIGTSLLGDTYDESTGEVLKDAPGWDKTTRTILNNEGCDWAGGRLREKQEALDECHRMHDAEVKRIQDRCDRLMAAAEARLAKATAPLLRDADFLENAIRAYAETHRAEILRGLRKGAKSRRFPSGLRVAWKSMGGEYRWRRDMTPKEREAALLAWAQVQDRALRFVELRPVPATERIKGVLEDRRRSGSPDLPAEAPGLEYVPEHEELSVKVEG